MVSTGVSENSTALKPYSRDFVAVLFAARLQEPGKGAWFNRIFEAFAIAFADVLAGASAPVLSPVSAAAAVVAGACVAAALAEASAGRRVAVIRRGAAVLALSRIHPDVEARRRSAAEISASRN